MNCPFYGRAMYQKGVIGAAIPFLLLDTNGNQCGLIADSHSPCRMEIDGETPDWRACILVKDIRMEAGR
jgi:hypothetical protein